MSLRRAPATKQSPEIAAGPARRQRAWRDLALLLPPLAAGLALRLWNLRDQVLGGDELHGVRAAVARAPGAILTQFSTVDHSLPLSALFSFLLRRGATLDEMAFRLPSLIAGGLLLTLLPWLALRELGRPTGAVLAWLLALSPALVLYSRIARSYLPMVLAGTLALAAFAAWWRRRTATRGLTFVLPAALAVWLHLLATPFVVAPFAWAVLQLPRLGRAERPRALRDLALLSAAFAATLTAFLLPALPSLLHLLAAKHGAAEHTAAAFADTVRLQAGTRLVPLACLVAGLAVLGWWRLSRTHPPLAALALLAAGTQALGVLALSPLASGVPLVLNRYLLPALPVLLLGVAHALAWPWDDAADAAPGQRAVRWLARLAAPLLLATLWWSGPLRSPAFTRGSFAHHNACVDFTAPPPRLADPADAALFSRLPPGPLVELPWPTAWNAGRGFPARQLVHGRRVLVAAVAGVPRHPGLRLRNEVPPLPVPLLASPAAAVVVHLCVPCAEDRVGGGGARAHAPRQALRDELVRQGEAAAVRLERAWGPPHAASGGVRVWDLTRLRRERERRRG